ncbi:hypothetical protein CYMTET_29357, partial [Cymbomonas tetramitiformis]
MISENVTLESTTDSDSTRSVETSTADIPPSQVLTEEEPAVLTIEDAIKALQKKQLATDKSQAEVYSAALVERLLKGGLREVAEKKPNKAVVPRQLERCHPPQQVYTKTARARWARIVPSVYNWTLPAVQVTSEDGFSGLFHRWNFATKSDPVIQTAPAPIFKGKWLRCAVVGPSANLMRTRYGSSIDSHDAPAGGRFKTQVGSKTTFRVFDTKGASSFMATGVIDRAAIGVNATLVVMARSTAEVYLDLKRKLSKRQQRADNVVALNEDWFFATHQLLLAYKICLKYTGRDIGGGDVPSTGLLAAYVMMHVCHELTLFGFDTKA